MMREARRRIVEYFGGVGFADLYRRLKPLPVDEKKRREIQRKDRLFVLGAVLEDDQMEEFGVNIWRIILSGATLRKNKTRHKEVKASDYLMLQRIVDGDRIYRYKEGPRRETHRVGFAKDDNGNGGLRRGKKRKMGRSYTLIRCTKSARGSWNKPKVSMANESSGKKLDACEAVTPQCPDVSCTKMAQASVVKDKGKNPHCQEIV